MSPEILMIAKAPRAGAVNTRLEPVLGPDGCARLQAELIRHTASWAARTASRAWLAYAPADARADVAALVPGAVELFAQTGDHLGQRLIHAVGRVHGEGERSPLVVIGTDSPLLGAPQVMAASEAVAGGWDAALIPALDGGYALIALARPSPAAFAIPAEAWGGPRVLALTLRVLRDGGLRAAVLDPVADLDTPADARALRGDPRCPAAIRAALAPALPKAA